MTRVLLLRHGPTDWNADGRVQGQTDVPLSDAGRRSVRSWKLPRYAADWEWHASPLSRAVETAALLGIDPARLHLDDRLKEIDWGDWEGAILRKLRAEQGEAMKRIEARGLDMAPPNGESPRQLNARLAGWLADVAARDRNICAVSHAGVLRGAYTLATGWDMRRASPLERGHAWAHLYDLAGDGALKPVTLNIRLADSEPPSGYDR